jgi:hypothetical protein
MRILRMCFLFSAILNLSWAVVAQSPSTQATQPVISLTLSSAQNSVKAGSPILVKVVMTNISGHGIGITEETHGRDYHIEVRDEKGKLPPDTKLGSVWNGNHPVVHPELLSPSDLSGNLISGTMPAGEKQNTGLDVSRFYDMSQPGKYSIQVQRADPENPSIVVKSNTITVTVTP